MKFPVHGYISSTLLWLCCSLCDCGLGRAVWLRLNVYKSIGCFCSLCADYYYELGLLVCSFCGDFYELKFPANQETAFKP